MLPVGMMSFGSVRHQAPQCLERGSSEGGLVASYSILGAVLISVPYNRSFSIEPEDRLESGSLPRWHEWSLPALDGDCFEPITDGGRDVGEFVLFVKATMLSK